MNVHSFQRRKRLKKIEKNPFIPPLCLLDLKGEGG